MHGSPKSKNQITASWSGPLPPPAALEKFNQIIPNGAERILAMAEKEQSARIEYEKAALSAAIIDTRRGHFLGASISILAILGAAYTAWIGAHWAVSCALVGIPILGIVKALVSSRSN